MEAKWLATKCIDGCNLHYWEIERNLDVQTPNFMGEETKRPECLGDLFKVAKLTRIRVAIRVY